MLRTLQVLRGATPRQTTDYIRVTTVELMNNITIDFSYL